MYDNYTILLSQVSLHVNIIISRYVALICFTVLCCYVFSLNITGLDYDAGPYVVTFIPRETSKYFPIRIINDNLYEGSENFTVTIHTLSKDMVRSNPYTATVEISDDECK